MRHLQVPGTQELLDDAEDLNEFFISRATVERRLRGLSPEERLRGLSLAERDLLRELLLKQQDR